MFVTLLIYFCSANVCNYYGSIPMPSTVECVDLGRAIHEDFGGNTILWECRTLE